MKRLTAFLLLLIALVALADWIIPVGVQHIQTGPAFANARVQWQNGDVFHSSGSFLQGAWVTVNGGIRMQFARPWVERTYALTAQHDFPTALDACNRAEYILAEYDDKGSVGYFCSILKVCIDRPNLPCNFGKPQPAMATQ